MCGGEVEQRKKLNAEDTEIGAHRTQRDLRRGGDRGSGLLGAETACGKVGGYGEWI
jgi:hypothetical protein